MKQTENNTQNKSVTENISVVIPLYNKIDFISACVDSVLNQTHKPGEIIIIDDGSTDGSGYFVQQHYGDKVRLIKQNNQGVSVARNTGIDSAQCEYVALLDADDQWNKNFLNKISQLIMDFSDCDVFATAYQLIYPEQTKTPDFHNLTDSFNGKITNYFKHSMNDWSILTSSSTVIRKSTLLKVGKFKPNLRLGEDTDLWCRLALNAKIAFSNQALSKYFCFNQSSVTKTIIPDDELEYSKFLTEMLQKDKIPLEMINDVKRFISKGLQYLVREQAKSGNYRFVTKFLKDKRLYNYIGISTFKMLLAIITPRPAYEFVKTSLANFKNNN